MARKRPKKNAYLDPAPLLRLFPHDMTNREIARQLDVDNGSVNAWKSGQRRIHWAKADVLATILGRHPSMIWGADWERTTIDDA